MYKRQVAWGSKLQATAVESTCAAEFVAENAATCLKDLLFEMTGNVVDAELCVDNQSAVGKLKKPAGGRMWLDLKWRILHQRHIDKLMRISFVPTSQQKADVFAKSLTPIMHEQAVSMLFMYCSKTKSTGFEGPEERSQLLKRGVKLPLPKHACIYKGATECAVCKEFYAGLQ